MAYNLHKTGICKQVKSIFKRLKDLQSTYQKRVLCNFVYDEIKFNKIF